MKVLIYSFGFWLVFKCKWWRFNLKSIIFRYFVLLTKCFPSSSSDHSIDLGWPNSIKKSKTLSFLLLLNWPNLKSSALRTEKNTGRSIKSDTREPRTPWRTTGQGTSTIECSLKSKPWQRPCDAWNALTVLAKKHVQLALISDHLFIKSKIKTIMVPPKLFFQTTHLAFLVEDFVLSVNFVPPPATLIGWKEAPLRSENCNNSLAKFSDKWKSNKSEILT